MVGLHGTICRPDLSARRRRSANLACILTADERPIDGNEDRSDSDNLGAYHLARKSGNFGLESNGKAVFRKIFSEIVDNLQR